MEETMKAPVVAQTVSTRSEAINEIAAALAKAQGAMRGAVKDAKNPHFKSSYADLASVWEACREALSGNGIAVMQPTAFDGQMVEVETILAHSSGQWVASVLRIRPMKPDAQGIGSAITYGRRYGLAAMVGVAPEDDDGEAAVGRNGNGNGQQAQQQRPQSGPFDVEKAIADMRQMIAGIKTPEDWAACGKVLAQFPKGHPVRAQVSAEFNQKGEAVKGEAA